MTNESLQKIMAYRLAAHDFISEFALRESSEELVNRGKHS